MMFHYKMLKFATDSNYWSVLIAASLARRASKSRHTSSNTNDVTQETNRFHAKDATSKNPNTEEVSSLLNYELFYIQITLII